MTVAELIKLLGTFDPDLIVSVAVEGSYVPVEITKDGISVEPGLVEVDGSPKGKRVDIKSLFIRG